MIMRFAKSFSSHRLFNFSTSYLREFERIFQSNLDNHWRILQTSSDHYWVILQINSENYWRMTDLMGAEKIFGIWGKQTKFYCKLLEMTMSDNDALLVVSMMSIMFELFANYHLWL